MILEKFNAAFQDLQFTFDHIVKENTATAYFQHLKGWDAADWQRAVYMIIENQERFPRLATCYKYLREAVAERREKEQRDRNQEWQERVEGVSGALALLPFPADLRALLDRREAGVITHAQLESALEEDRRKSPADHVECNETGLVYAERSWKHGTYQQALRCRCKFGIRWSNTGLEMDFR